MGIETAALSTYATYATLAATAASAAVGGAAAYQQGRVAKAGAESQANMAEAAAQAEERRAMQERAVSQRNAEEERRKIDFMMGKQRAAGAASGGGMDGSVSDIIAETAGEQQLRSDLALWQGEESAAGREDQAAVYRMKAENERQQASKYPGIAKMQIASSVLGTVGTLAGKIPTGGGSTGGWDTTVNYADGRSEKLPKSRGIYY